MYNYTQQYINIHFNCLYKSVDNMNINSYTNSVKYECLFIY